MTWNGAGQGVSPPELRQVMFPSQCDHYTTEPDGSPLHAEKNIKSFLFQGVRGAALTARGKDALLGSEIISRHITGCGWARLRRDGILCLLFRGIRTVLVAM